MPHGELIVKSFVAQSSRGESRVVYEVENPQAVAVNAAVQI